MISVAESTQKKILIVDDDEDLLTALEIRLELMNFKVFKASAAKEALQKITSENPDLIILDINLPGLSGIDICDILKKDPKTSHIPIIFLTALSDDHTEFSARNVGGFAFLTKPLDPVQFQAQLREALSKVNFEVGR